MQKKIKIPGTTANKGINTTGWLFLIIVGELMILGWLTLLIFHTNTF
jgi:hypothetical protein